MHHQHITSASSPHHQFIISASSVYHQCIISASYAHHQCIISASLLCVHCWVEPSLLLSSFHSFHSTQCNTRTRSMQLTAIQATHVFMKSFFLFFCEHFFLFLFLQLLKPVCSKVGDSSDLLCSHRSKLNHWQTHPSWWIYPWLWCFFWWFYQYVSVAFLQTNSANGVVIITRSSDEKRLNLFESVASEAT